MRHDAWSDEHIEAVRTMWAAGYSARQIGNAVGRSRNAVIGRVHRMGLATRTLVARKAASKAHTPRPPRPKRVASIKPTIAYAPPVKREPVKMEYAEPLRVHISDVQFNHCRRPLWPDRPKPSFADMYFCGLPIRPKSSFRFCEACASRLLVPVAERKAPSIGRYLIRRAAA